MVWLAGWEVFTVSIWRVLRPAKHARSHPIATGAGNLGT